MKEVSSCELADSMPAPGSRHRTPYLGSVVANLPARPQGLPVVNEVVAQRLLGAPASKRTWQVVRADDWQQRRIRP